MNLSTYTLELIAALTAFPLLLGILLWTGGLLRKRMEVPLGIRYKVAAAAFSAYIPLKVYEMFVAVQFADAMKKALPAKGDEGALPLKPVFIPESLLQGLLAAGIFFGALLAVSLVRKYFWEGWFARTQSVRVPKFISEIGGVLIVGVALLFIAQVVYRFNLSGLQLGSTVSVAVIGFASQDLLGNLLSGMALQVASPFKPGDWLLMEGKRLQVVEVNWRATRMRMPDNVMVEVPNKTIAGGMITNLSAPTTERAVSFTLGFEYAAPPEEVKACLKAAVLEIPGVLPAPGPKVILKEFGESAIQYEVSFWVPNEESLVDISDAVKTRIWHVAGEKGYRMPYPVRVIHLEHPESLLSGKVGGV